MFKFKFNFKLGAPRSTAEGRGCFWHSILLLNYSSNLSICIGDWTFLILLWLSVSQEQTKALEVANLATAVSLPVIFGDERDAIIAKWNQLQAYWGFGKAFYNQQAGVVSLDASNPFCRFKVKFNLRAWVESSEHTLCSLGSPGCQWLICCTNMSHGEASFTTVA